MWLIVGNGYLQCDGEREVDVLDEDGGLAARRWGGGNFVKCLKKG